MPTLNTGFLSTNASMEDDEFCVIHIEQLLIASSIDELISTIVTFPKPFICFSTKCFFEPNKGCDLIRKLKPLFENFSIKILFLGWQQLGIL